MYIAHSGDRSASLSYEPEYVLSSINELNRVKERKRSINSLLLLESIRPKLQALVYDILPSTTVIVDYAIGLEKLSANGHFCCC